MSTQSKRLNRFCRGLIASVALPAVVAMFGATPARAGVAGAIYTTTSTGTKVNANLYALKSDVYLNGGPQNQNDPGIVPDGTYYFQVTNPNGDLLLSSDCAVCRQVTV